MANKLSWDNLDDYDHKEYDELCKQSTPADFYFAVSNSLSFDPNDNDAFTFIAIVPKAFFDKERCMLDSSMDLEHILPEDFGEEMEGIWSTSRSVDEVRKDMLERGFEENQKFVDAAKE
jgi:hypothetical protein